MPPRGSRGKLARGRGGRGKAPTKLAEEPSCSAQEPAGTNTNDEPTSQSTLEASSATESARVTTPQRLQDADPSPNSSPATVPTETPAPTPARPTQQPDESAAGSSAVASPTRGGGGVTRGKRGRGGTAAPSKFKPKIIRREQSEREELAREEQKRKETAAAQVAREEARLSRGRGRGFPGRGRGDAMGRGRDDRKTTATGTFGVAPAELGISFPQAYMALWLTCL
jgi:DNA-directed RNA polymerase III subunit RPC4